MSMKIPRFTGDVFNVIIVGDFLIGATATGTAYILLKGEI